MTRPLNRSLLFVAVLLFSPLLLTSCGGPRVGVGCETDRDCADVCLRELAGGFCTERCMTTDDCPKDTICADTEAVTGGVCLYPCTSTAECVDMLQQGYVCDTESELGGSGGDVRVCVD